MPEPKFLELCKLDSRILDLYNQAKTVTIRKGHCVDDTWYRNFKPRVVDLVGMWRVEPGQIDLFTNGTYDVVYATIYGALPDCPDCSCEECEANYQEDED